MKQVKAISEHISPQPVASIVEVQSSCLVQAAHSSELSAENRFGGIFTAFALRAMGIKCAYTLTGGHVSPSIIGCERLGYTKIVDVRDEKSAAFAADAYARLTGGLGCCIVTAGPGLTNMVTAARNALMAESPVLVIGGATAQLLVGRGSLQDIDQPELMKSNVKRVFQVKTVSQILPTLLAAGVVAKTAPPGPVFVEIPLDTAWPEDYIEKQAIKEDTGGSIQRFIARMFSKYQLHHIFGDPYSKVHGLALPKPKSHALQLGLPPKPSDVRLLAKALASAQKPVFILGSQIVSSRSVSACNFLRAAVEALGVPVFLSGMARGLMGRNHPLHISHARGKALKSADMVCVLGTPLDFRLDYGRSINSNAALFLVSYNKDTLYRNADLRSAQLYALASPGPFLVELAKVARKAQIPLWLNELRTRNSARDAEIAEKAAIPPSQPGQVNPLTLLKCVDKVMSDEAVIVADGGDFVSTASYILKPRGPLGWLDPGVFGTLGVGGGFALAGRSILPPTKEVWLIWGDGSCAWSLAELDSMARVQQGCPVVCVVGNDGAWMQILRDQQKVFKTKVACELPQLRYDQAAEGYGAIGFCLTDGRQDAIQRTLEDAQRTARDTGRPVVINVMLEKSDFREGSLSV